MSVNPVTPKNQAASFFSGLSGGGISFLVPLLQRGHPPLFGKVPFLLLREGGVVGQEHFHYDTKKPLGMGLEGNKKSPILNSRTPIIIQPRRGKNRERQKN